MNITDFWHFTPKPNSILADVGCGEAVIRLSFRCIQFIRPHHYYRTAQTTDRETHHSEFDNAQSNGPTSSSMVRSAVRCLNRRDGINAT